MKVGFVANSHGNLELLESFLLMLVERHEVDVLVAVGGTAPYDAAAVLRARLERHPVEVAWTEPGYADFVLASISRGVVQAPAEEVDRNKRLQARLRANADRVEIGERVLAVKIPGASPPETGPLVFDEREERGVERGERVLICPGQLRGMLWDGQPASCALVEPAKDRLRVRFLDLDGADIDEAEII